MTQVQLVRDALHDFCEASGLKINLNKSKVVCFSKDPRVKRGELAAISSIRFIKNLGTDLGFLLIQGWAPSNFFNSVVEKIQRRMDSWKGHLLNRVGKICLAK